MDKADKQAVEKYANSGLRFVVAIVFAVTIGLVLRACGNFYIELAGDHAVVKAAQAAERAGEDPRGRLSRIASKKIELSALDLLLLAAIGGTLLVGGACCIYDVDKMIGERLKKIRSALR